MTPRVQSLDALRGLVMVVMALDHVRDFFHAGAMLGSPTDLATTTPAVFLTRWVTHFCAPVFVLAAGVGAFLWQRRHEGSVAWYLVTRGLWLIAIELVVMRVAFDFSLSKTFPVLLITLWALGGSMIGLALLVRLPPAVLGGLSVAVIALHNLTDGVRASSLGSLGWVWNVLHQPGMIPVSGVVVLVGYPLLPLTATMAAGYVLGTVMLDEGSRRQALLRRLGWAMVAAFVVLRWVNVYGDPSPWKPQGSATLTALSFLNVTKYPASLDFLLMTLGPALVVWAWLERRDLSPRNPLVVFGRVPLFYFVAHFFWIHMLLVAAAGARYGFGWYLLQPLPSMGGPRTAFPAGFGFELWTVYAVWVLVVVTMYPLCRWYGTYGWSRSWAWGIRRR